MFNVLQEETIVNNEWDEQMALVICLFFDGFVISVGIIHMLFFINKIQIKTDMAGIQDAMKNKKRVVPASGIS